MKTELRYDVFFGISFEPFVKRAWDIFGNEFCFDNVELIPPRMAPGVDPNDVLDVNSYRYDAQGDDESPIPYMIVNAATLDDEEIVCPHFNKLARSFFNRRVGYLEYMGANLTAGFIPCDDRWRHSFFLTESFLNALTETRFAIGNAVKKLDVETLYNQSEINRLDSYDSLVDRKPLERRPLYYVVLEPYIGLENEKRLYVAATCSCTACGYDKCFCTECYSWLSRCPNCGNDFNGLGIRRVFGNIKEEESPLSPAKTGQYAVYDRHANEWRRQDAAPINAKLWNGADLFSLKTYFGFEYGCICTGRVAKWLVANEYGPISLVRVPVDVSTCSSEELERLEEVSYRYDV
ncbi:MAG: hypothetical protein IJU03_03630 [Thermoguttaceae bacterium]|nr:hypothetical protein [Thermoguttaceae bacterium]